MGKLRTVETLVVVEVFSHRICLIVRLGHLKWGEIIFEPSVEGTVFCNRGVDSGLGHAELDVLRFSARAFELVITPRRSDGFSKANRAKLMPQRAV